MNNYIRKISRHLLAASMIAGASLSASAAINSKLTSTSLTPPTPTASKGSYTSYVKVSWSKVSGATGYYVFRSSSSCWSAASQLKKISSASTITLNDSSAVAGQTYYYWVCPYKGTTYYYNASKYASGYRKATASVSLSNSSVTAGTTVYVYYKNGNSYAIPNSMTYSQSSSGVGTAYKYSKLSGNACGYITTAKAGTITINCGGVSTKLTVTSPSYSYTIESSASVKVGNSIALWCKRSDGTYIKPTWSVSSTSYATVSSSSSQGGSGTLTGKKAGSVTLYANFGGKKVASKTISVTANSTVNPSPSTSSGYLITGSTTLKYGSSYKFTLYYNGKKVSNATWSVGSYLTKSVSSGVLTVKPTSKPVSYNSSAVYAFVNGKKVGSKSVKITR